MHAMHEFDRHVARFRSTQDRCNETLPQTAGSQTGAPRAGAGTFSVRPLAALEHDETAVLCVHGEIDLETAPLLREALLPVLEHQAGPIVLDLSEVPFMDSSGVHVLVDALQRLEAQNRRLTVACREHGQVHRLLALVGLLDVVTVHPPSRDERRRGQASARADLTSSSPLLRKRAPDASILAGDSEARRG